MAATEAWNGVIYCMLCAGGINVQNDRFSRTTLRRIRFVVESSLSPAGAALGRVSGRQVISSNINEIQVSVFQISCCIVFEFGPLMIDSEDH